MTWVGRFRVLRLVLELTPAEVAQIMKIGGMETDPVRIREWFRSFSTPDRQLIMNAREFDAFLDGLSRWWQEHRG